MPDARSSDDSAPMPDDSQCTRVMGTYLGRLVRCGMARSVHATLAHDFQASETDSREAPNA